MLFRKRKSEAHEIAKVVVEETKVVLNEFRVEVDHRFSEVKAMLSKLETDIEALESKLFTKEIRDRQEYGQLQYKMNEVGGSESLKQEISKLKSQLNKLKQLDH